MAEESNITGDWFVGEDKTFPFTIYQKSAAGVLSGTPQDITGWALKWELRISDASVDPATLTKVTPTGITINAGTGGTGFVTITDTDTDALAARVYRHALKRTDDGSETVLLYGDATLGKRTTR